MERPPATHSSAIVASNSSSAQTTRRPPTMHHERLADGQSAISRKSRTLELLGLPRRTKVEQIRERDLMMPQEVRQMPEDRTGSPCRGPATHLRWKASILCCRAVQERCKHRQPTQCRSAGSRICPYFKCTCRLARSCNGPGRSWRPRRTETRCERHRSCAQTTS